jgi:hypothetical protein
MNPKSPSSLLIRLLAVAAVTLSTLSVASLAQAKSVPGDGATPIVELMPLSMRYEAELKLSADQIKVLDAFRKEAMPVRVGIQKKIIELRGQLRMAILDNKPPAEREALMQQIAEAEVAHFKGHDRCVEFFRKTLSADQFAQITRLYLEGLR